MRSNAAILASLADLSQRPVVKSLTAGVTGVASCIALLALAGAGREVAAAFQANRRGPSEVAEAGLRSDASVGAVPVLNSFGALDTLRFGEGTSVVLITDDACNVCKVNIARWLDLLVELRGRYPVYALGLGDNSAEVAFWRGLERHVRVATVLRDSVILEEFGTTRVPATVIIRDSRVHLVIRGILSDGLRARLLRDL